LTRQVRLRDERHARTKCLERLHEFNQLRPSEQVKRQAMMKEMFAEIGENCYIEPPFYANFGSNIYVNFNFTCVDDTHIYVGVYTMFGPNVTISAAGHPIIPELRRKGYQYNMPVRIGSGCWIGAGVNILPGINDRDKEFHFKDRRIDYAQLNGK
jgi:galactoside O-acetyltransferase